MLSSPYYAKNCAGIIDTGLVVMQFLISAKYHVNYYYLAVVISKTSRLIVLLGCLESYGLDNKVKTQNRYYHLTVI